jgi:hypothetical protein
LPKATAKEMANNVRNKPAKANVTAPSATATAILTIAKKARPVKVTATVKAWAKEMAKARVKEKAWAAEKAKVRAVVKAKAVVEETNFPHLPPGN